MRELDVQNIEKVQLLIDEKGIFHVIDEYLAANNLGHLKAHEIKLAVTSSYNKQLSGPCPKGQVLKQVCHKWGCGYECR
jgi:hypothetical protein